MVRIIKKMRYLMEDNDILSAKEVSSFGLESLLWNIPNDIYTKYQYNYRFAFNEVVNYLMNHKSALSFYREVNGVKKLCNTKNDEECYIRFIDDLRRFYQYDIKEA